MHLLNLRGKVYTNSSYSVGRMFQWLYDGTIGNMIGPKEETLCEKVQVRNSVYFMMCRMLFDVVNYVEQDNGLIHLASYHGQLQVLQRLLTQGMVM